jgi:hypothetical protein
MRARKPVALDLYCCAGGATRGYQQAGFYVVGVDKVKRPDYCGDEFVEEDAIQFLRSEWACARPFPFAIVHASPPCQADCAINLGNQKGKPNEHVSLTGKTRDALLRTNVPWVIEQPVGGSRLIRKDLKLHGDMFGLDVKRARWFEFGNVVPPVQPVQAPSRGRTRGWRHGVKHDGPYVAVYGKGGGKATVAEAQAAMGIDWTDEWEALTEAIPPAYTRYIGEHLMNGLGR